MFPDKHGFSFKKHLAVSHFPEVDKPVFPSLAVYFEFHGVLAVQDYKQVRANHQYCFVIEYVIPEELVFKFSAVNAYLAFTQGPGQKKFMPPYPVILLLPYSPVLNLLFQVGGILIRFRQMKWRSS